MSGQGHEEQYAQRLREQYADAAPLIDIDPDVVIRRGRNRRYARWGAGLAAVAVLAVIGAALLPGIGGRGWFDGVAPASSTPPPEPTDAEASLWVSAPRVPPGADLAVAIVSHGDAQLYGGVGATVERWDGQAWQSYGFAGMCTDFWQCEGTITRQEEGGNDIGVGSGSVMRVSTDGLSPGWYRLSENLFDEPETPDSRRQIVAAGQFQVEASAPDPAPLWALDGVTYSLSPALLTPVGGTLRMTPVVPSNPDGSLSADEIAAAVADMSETASIERWAGGAWVVVGEVKLAPDPESGNTYDHRTEVPALPAGEYRLVRTGPQGEQAGNFWVVDSGPVFLPLKAGGASRNLTQVIARVEESRDDPGVPDEFYPGVELAACGGYVLDQGVDATTVPWSCLQVGQDSGFGVELVVVRLTTEGDPIATYYRAIPSTSEVEAWVDATMDRFGSGQWEHLTCTLSDGEPRCS